MTAPTGLAKKSIGTSSLFWFCVGASAPMTVLAGSVTATFALTGVAGTPVSFLVIALALYLFSVGYVAMARHVPHAATFYAFFARGSVGSGASRGRSSRCSPTTPYRSASTASSEPRWPTRSVVSGGSGRWSCGP